MNGDLIREVKADFTDMALRNLKHDDICTNQMPQQCIEFEKLKDFKESLEREFASDLAQVKCSLSMKKRVWLAFIVEQTKCCRTIRQTAGEKQQCDRPVFDHCCYFKQFQAPYWQKLLDMRVWSKHKGCAAYLLWEELYDVTDVFDVAIDCAQVALNKNITPAEPIIKCLMEILKKEQLITDREIMMDSRTKDYYNTVREDHVGVDYMGHDVSPRKDPKYLHSVGNDVYPYLPAAILGNPDIKARDLRTLQDHEEFLRRQAEVAEYGADSEYSDSSEPSDSKDLPDIRDSGVKCVHWCPRRQAWQVTWQFLKDKRETGWYDPKELGYSGDADGGVNRAMQDAIYHRYKMLRMGCKYKGSNTGWDGISWKKVNCAFVVTVTIPPTIMRERANFAAEMRPLANEAGIKLEEEKKQSNVVTKSFNPTKYKDPKMALMAAIKWLQDEQRKVGTWKKPVYKHNNKVPTTIARIKAAKAWSDERAKRVRVRLDSSTGYEGINWHKGRRAWEARHVSSIEVEDEKTGKIKKIRTFKYLYNAFVKKHISARAALEEAVKIRKQKMLELKLKISNTATTHCPTNKSKKLMAELMGENTAGGSSSNSSGDCSGVVDEDGKFDGIDGGCRYTGISQEGLDRWKVSIKICKNGKFTQYQKRYKWSDYSSKEEALKHAIVYRNEVIKLREATNAQKKKDKDAAKRKNTTTIVPKTKMQLPVSKDAEKKRAVTKGKADTRSSTGVTKKMRTRKSKSQVSLTYFFFVLNHIFH